MVFVLVILVPVARISPGNRCLTKYKEMQVEDAFRHLAPALLTSAEQERLSDTEKQEKRDKEEAWEFPSLDFLSPFGPLP